MNVLLGPTLSGETSLRQLTPLLGRRLLDQPLANLDYKLREELRIEIPKIFEASGAVFVYATTEPEEALLLGGNVATLWEGRITQFGLTPSVFRKPVDATTARVFPAQGNVAQQMLWYTAFTADTVKPGLPVMNEDGTPKWRMAPSPHGAYWKEGQKVGYQDAGSWTLMTFTPVDRAQAAWLWPAAPGCSNGRNLLATRMATLRR